MSDQTAQNPETESPPSPLEAVQTELENCKKDSLYLRAEFDNYRKNAIKERSELLKFGGEKLITALLDILDNFERALETKVTEESIETYRRGVELTAQELKAVLQKFGVQDLNAVGHPFDPALHEALSAEETDEIPEGHVYRVFKKPYKYHDKLIRPGQVVVAKSKSTPQ